MRRQSFKIGILTAVFVAISTIVFSYIQQTASPSINTEACCKKEASKNTEMLFEKLAKRFVGAVSMD